MKKTVILILVFLSATCLYAETKSLEYNLIIFRAGAKLDIGDYAGALPFYNEAIDIETNDAKLYYNRGLCKENTEDLDGAIKDYSLAIKLNAKYEDAYFHRAKTYERLGKARLSYNDFTTVYSLNGSNKEALINRIRIYKKVKEEIEKEALLQEQKRKNDEIEQRKRDKFFKQYTGSIILVCVDLALAGWGTYQYLDYKNTADNYNIQYAQIDNTTPANYYILFSAHKTALDKQNSFLISSGIAGTAILYTVLDAIFIHAVFPVDVAFNYNFNTQLTQLTLRKNF